MTRRAQIAERVFAALLRAYPAGFRAEYAREMTQLFRDRRRLDRAGGVSFWIETVWDVARSAATMRTEARDRMNPHITEGTMRPMAILAVLIGVFQLVNATVEWSAGRASVGNEYSMASVALGVIAAVLLVSAGVAMLRRRSDAATWVRIAAVACLVLIVLIRIVHPWMSVFATLLGIGFPIALLIFLYVNRHGGRSGPMTA